MRVEVTGSGTHTRSGVCLVTSGKMFGPAPEDGGVSVGLQIFSCFVFEAVMLVSCRRFIRCQQECNTSSLITDALLCKLPLKVKLLPAVIFRLH